MNDFTASNGVIVRAFANGGAVTIEPAFDHPSSVHPIAFDALREFFQAEADGRHGIWRPPGDSDVMVFKIDDDTIRLIHLRNRGVPTTFARYDQDGLGPSSAIARAYFDAHPEPKPIPNEPRTAWVDKYGTDVWVVGPDGVLRCVFSPSSDPNKYAPFTRLVPEKQS